MESPARLVSRGLAENVEAVCRHYLSNGCRSGNYWIVGDVNNHPGRSLYVRLKGPLSGKGARGHWADAATDQHGDLLDLIAAREGCASFKRTLDEARRFLRMPLTHCERQTSQSGERDYLALARKIWTESRPIAGTAAEDYLRARNISADFDDAPLRYHPALIYRESANSPKRKLPALVAAVTNHRGELTGVHRTFIDPTRNDKARVSSPRRSLGAILGNGVSFGKVDDVVLLGEGIETVLSIKSARPDIPMVAALSAGHLAAWDFPPELRRLIIARDNDEAGRRGAERLLERAEALGILTTTICSLRADFNSDLCATSDGALRNRLDALLTPVLAFA